MEKYALSSTVDIAFNTRCLDYHTDQLKGNISSYNNIYMGTALAENFKVSKNVFQIDNSLNTNLLNKKEQHLLMKLLTDSKSITVRIEVVNFRVVKESNKKSN